VEHPKLLASITHALHLIGEQELHGHTSYVVGHMLQELRPSDLTDSEMMAVAIILAHAHARKVGRPKPTTVVPIKRVNATDPYPHLLYG
jgi:hypothetical protein